MGYEFWGDLYYEKKQGSNNRLGVVSRRYGIERYWESLLNGRSGINKITKFDTTDYNVKIAEK